MALSLAACGGGESSSSPDSKPITDPQPTGNSAPVIEGEPALTAKAGVAYSFAPMATDADASDTLTYSATGLPTWLTFNESTGAMSGMPEDGDVGQTDDIEITVSDGKAQDSIGPFRIQVAARDAAPAPSNAAPTISGTPASTVVAGTAYSFSPTAADSNGDKLSFAIANRPRWAAFDTATGKLSGTPTASNVGTFWNVRISVTDGKVTTSLPTFSIQVTAAPSSPSPAPANRAPTISGTPATSAQVGAAYSFQPTATDADGDALTWTIKNKPTWATFSSTGKLSGTPTAAATAADIIISVSDGKTTVSLPSFSITVRSNTTTGSATLSWTPPTTNTDGTSLGNLAGYRVHYGNSTTALNMTQEVGSAGVTSTTIENLTAGTWYFSVQAYNAAGVESSASNIASKTIL